MPLAQAQDFSLPTPGVMVHLSPPVDPPMLKGIKVHPDNPFLFDFILDRGDRELTSNELKDESSKLIKYFLASLTIPEKDLWVNLSPYEKDRIIPNSFGLTEMGRDLLAEDYMLKQITASLIYPEDAVGKKFWKRVYEEASKKYGTTNIPVNTFNKVWIVPEKALVYENAKAGTAYVVESKLKVMLEEDYLSLEKHAGISLSRPGDMASAVSPSTLPSELGLNVKASQGNHSSTNALGSQIVREIVLPQLSTEINENKSFAKLRQVYNSLILATWYKMKIKDSVLAQVYADKNKVAGVNIDDPKEKERIYKRYLQAFKKGVYNYIKEEADPLTQEIIPRKYFSGGLQLNPRQAIRVTTDSAMIGDLEQLSENTLMIEAKINSFDQTIKQKDRAILVKVSDTEAEHVLNRVEIHGGALNSSLLPEDIERLGMKPKYKVEQGGRTIYFSTPYQVGKNWTAVLGYVQDGNIFIGRTYYTSGSQALWRYLPRVSLNDENKIGWFDKGYSEDSLPLPYQVQKFLGKMLDQEKPVAFQESDWVLLFAGTTNSEARTYRGVIEPTPQKVTFKDDPGVVGGYIQPGRLDFPNSDDRPDLDRLIDQYTFNSLIYGSLTARVFPSASGKYKFTFMEDRKGRCWIANIETNGPLSTLGLSASWVKGGSFTVPAYEYAEQAYGYGNSDDVVYRPGTTKVRYVDMWKNYLSKIPVIKEFHRRYVENQDDEPTTVTQEAPTVVVQSKVQGLTFRQKATLNWTDHGSVILKVGQTLVQIKQDEEGLFGVRISKNSGKELSRRAYFQEHLDLGRDGKTKFFKMNDVMSTAWADPDVSREHARVEIKGNLLTVEDLGSTHGTRYADGDLTPNILKDFAMSTSLPVALKIQNKAEYGGIDLTPANMNLRTQNAGEAIKFRLDPVMLQNLQNATGFVPEILNIQPMTNLKTFLGLNSSDEKLA